MTFSAHSWIDLTGSAGLVSVWIDVFALRFKTVSMLTSSCFSSILKNLIGLSDSVPLFRYIIDIHSAEVCGCF